MAAKMVILGLLVEQPLHGYGVEKLIKERGMRKWTPIGFSSIYHLLDQLVDDGLAEVELEPAPGRGKERKVHHVTPDGRNLWTKSTLKALADVADSDGGFLIALSGLPQLEPGDAVHALEQRRSLLESQIVGLDADLHAMLPVPDHVDAMFSCTRAQLSASLAWLIDFLSAYPKSVKESSP